MQAHLRQAVKLTPTDGDAHFRLGRCRALFYGAGPLDWAGAATCPTTLKMQHRAKKKEARNLRVAPGVTSNFPMSGLGSDE